MSVRSFSAGVSRQGDDVMGRLAGKVAVVTGGGQGVGLGIARAFAREGAALVISGRTEATLKAASAELEALGAKVVACVAEASSRQDAQRVVARAVETCGGLHVLVNNAQSSKPGTPL